MKKQMGDVLKQNGSTGWQGGLWSQRYVTL